jgi:methyl-accepting chemotaxis protein
VSSLKIWQKFLLVAGVAWAPSLVVPLMHGVDPLGLGIAVVGLMVAMFVAASAASSLGSPLQEATQVAQKLQAGELDFQTHFLSREDEIGDLLRSLEKTREGLLMLCERATQASQGDLEGLPQPRSDRDRLLQSYAALVGSVRGRTRSMQENVRQIAQLADKMLQASGVTSEAAGQMLQSMDRATVTVEEVRQRARLAETRAKNVAVTASGAALVSGTGQNLTDSTLQEMDKIRKQMETIAESVVQLSEQGQAIGHIISTVNDLAGQSNLLAVNASIESAKAGEHGRGFAVVAQEVKNLADESKQATLQVRAILGDIEKATAAAVMVAEQGTKAVDIGLVQSRAAGEAIRTLGSRVVEAVEAAEQISEASSQQLVEVDQVVRAINSVKSSGTQIAADLQQGESSARQLASLSQSLQEMLGGIKV